MSKLPDDFIAKMRTLFEILDRENEFSDFIESFEKTENKAIRINSNKVKKSDTDSVLEKVFRKSAEGSVFKAYKKVPWSDDGWIVPSGSTPGRHPYYNAGLYYIQEPSAMLPAYLAKAHPGEKVIDLCAAPGGKTVKLSADMCNKGLLISNDINNERVRPLVRNIELTGCTNCLVTNEPPSDLAEAYPGFFDVVLADAPCAGEGMFRRDENAARSWEEYRTKSPLIQCEILKEADKMLKPGGRLIYSTCTFSPEENEEMIAGFIASHPGYSVIDIFEKGYLSDGTDLDQTGAVRGIRIKGFDTHLTARIFPHNTDGEGHFCAVMQKSLNAPEFRGSNINVPAIDNRMTVNEKSTGFRNAFRIFSEEVLSEPCISKINGYINSHLEIYQDNVYTFNVPVDLPERIKFIKKGFFLGVVRQTRKGPVFEPSHQLIMSLNKGDVRRSVSFDSDSPEVRKYLRGETIFADASCRLAEKPGYIAVEADGFPLGWGKIGADGTIKNLYPKGWRKQ